MLISIKVIDILVKDILFIGFKLAFIWLSTGLFMALFMPQPSQILSNSRIIFSLQSLS